MPTLHRWAGHRVYFVTHDCREPAHVHVDHGERSIKVWLSGLRVSQSIGFSSVEIGRILRELSDRKAALIEAWDEHCGRAAERGPRR